MIWFITPNREAINTSPTYIVIMRDNSFTCLIYVMAVHIRVATLHMMLLLDCKPVFLAKKRRVIIIIRGDCKIE